MDDLVFFARADYVNCATIKDVLDESCKMSRQIVSEAKSRVYFSPNMDRDTRESFCDILGFASTSFLGKYLGTPIKQPGTSSQDYNFILDRVKQKLAGWKVHMLLLAGCSILIQASSTAIPSSKKNPLGWMAKVIKSKKEGGLGLQIVKGRNMALLAKLNWRLHIE